MNFSNSSKAMEPGDVVEAKDDIGERNNAGRNGVKDLEVIN